MLNDHFHFNGNFEPYYRTCDILVIDVGGESIDTHCVYSFFLSDHQPFTFHFLRDAQIYIICSLLQWKRIKQKWKRSPRRKITNSKFKTMKCLVQLRHRLRNPQQTRRPTITCKLPTKENHADKPIARWYELEVQHVYVFHTL